MACDTVPFFLIFFIVVSILTRPEIYCLPYAGFVFVYHNIKQFETIPTNKMFSFFLFSIASD